MDHLDIVHLQCSSSAEGGLCNIYVVGTNIGDLDSNMLVRNIIMSVRPEAIFLELCNEGFAKLVAQEDKQVQTLKDLFYLWLVRKNNYLHFMANWHSMKRRSPEKQLVTSVFQVAYEGAKQVGAKLVPGNRPAKITMDRLWIRLAFIEKAFFACLLFAADIFCQHSKQEQDEYRAANDEDMGFLGVIPRAYETLRDERQMYMAYNLFKEARQCSSIVSVVGNTHLFGIRNYWPSVYTIDMEELCKIPVQETISTAKIWAFVGYVYAILLFIFRWRK